MFRIVSGSVRLSVMGEDGRDLLYQLFGPGDCFGTSSVIDGEPRPQTADAHEDVELQLLDRTTIDRLRLTHFEINSALLKLLSRHMRLLSDHFAGATLNEVSFRLAQRLTDIAQTFGETNTEGIALSTRLSQSELAAMVGTTRQTVNRMLQRFQEQGWLSIRNGAIVLTNLPALEIAAHSGARLRDFSR
ncbi:CRP/FNR family transcriptional regulator [Sphingobium sp. TKS]|nr:CRP/FNR family transcriptional regulator [Sphingobium sp. TKS]